ncbi:MAG: hypothetical protein GY711_35840 [bacterium]|nr:hypothetical protein [bacterium]
MKPLIGILCLLTTSAFAVTAPARPQGELACYQPPAEWLDDYRAAVESGAIVRSTTPGAVTRLTPGGFLGPSCSAPVVFAYEDTHDVLLNHFPSRPFMAALMADAANGVIAQAGDEFDFIGFWMTYPLQFTGAGGLYESVKNDVHGIGDPSGGLTPDGIFDLHDFLQLSGERVRGFLFFLDINHPDWQPGSGVGATAARILVNHEFEHAFGVYLPDLADGRRLQGEGEFPAPFDPCGDVFHWNWRIDGQGSCMQISEWVGAGPAMRLPGAGGNPFNYRFNTDIPGGVYSYTDLYLMGLVSPAEMDAGNSELRYMDDSSNCAVTYNGSISDFTSADIVAVAGERVPDSTTSPKDFRTAWVMIHRTGDMPNAQEIGKLTGIVEQQAVDWNHSTLGRSTMNSNLSPLGSSYCAASMNSGGESARIEAFGCTDLTASGELTLSADRLPEGQFGYFLAGQTQGVFQPPGSQGLLCISGNIGRFNLSGEIIQGSTGTLQVDLSTIPVNPPTAVLPGDTWHFQCWFRDNNPGPTSNFTDAVSVTFQ